MVIPHGDGNAHLCEGSPMVRAKLLLFILLSLLFFLAFFLPLLLSLIVLHCIFAVTTESLLALRCIFADPTVSLCSRQSHATTKEDARIMKTFCL